MDPIYLFFSSLRWQDILDIGISSYILFRLYTLFRGTAAFRVMVGLAFLWLLQGLSRNKTIIAAWNGSFVNGYITYAKPDQPEYRRYPANNILIINPKE